jgi:hypothetical protein
VSAFVAANTALSPCFRNFDNVDEPDDTVVLSVAPVTEVVDTDTLFMLESVVILRLSRGRAHTAP